VLVKQVKFRFLLVKSPGLVGLIRRFQEREREERRLRREHRLKAHQSQWKNRGLSVYPFPWKVYELMVKFIRLSWVYFSIIEDILPLIIWLVVWNMNFIFHFIYGMSSFPLTFLFFRGFQTTNQPLYCQWIGLREHFDRKKT